MNEPPSDDEKFFKGKALTYYGRWTYKYEEAARRGAVGVLIIHRTDLASYGWEVVRNSQAIEKSYLARTTRSQRCAPPHGFSMMWRSGLFTLAGLGDLDQAIDRAGKRGFHAVELNVQLRGDIESHVRRYVSTNVVARVPGAAPSGNSVLYTAHYDHLGIDPDAKGDNIYNGAADNGTGCGILLEMARAFAQSPSSRRRTTCTLPRSPQRSRACWARSISACIRPSLRVRSRSILTTTCCCPSAFRVQSILLAPSASTFGRRCRTVAKAFDLQLLPDPNPMAGHYYRSDHFSLARVGIPAFSVDQGDLFEGHDAAWGRCAERGLHRASLPPAFRRVQCRLGFQRQREAGALRLRGWAGSPANRHEAVEWLPAMSSRQRGRRARTR